MIVGLDQSKRSTGIVGINYSGELINFNIIAIPEKDNEELIDSQWKQIHYFLDGAKEDITEVSVEGLSFNSVGSSKDWLAGLFWYIRVRLFLLQIPTRIVPTMTWRSKLFTKEERAAIKLNKAKDAIKIATVGKLPFEVRVKFEDYIRENGLKKTAIYDAADAYYIAQYSLSQLNKK